MSFFSSLYCGKLCPIEQTPNTDEFRTASTALASASKTLVDALSPDQKQLLDVYRNAQDECTVQICTEAFRQGFLLGAEFIQEIPEVYRSLQKE